MSRQPTDLARFESAGLWCARLSEGALTSSEQRDFEAWLAVDSANAGAFEECVAIWRAAGEDSTSPALLAYRRDALADFERNSRARWKRKLPAGALLTLAACLILVVSSVLGWQILAPVTYSTGLGERRVIALRDGSKVSLDARTTVRVRYSGKARQLWLNAGRAKFSVAHDPQRPFTVTAADKIVRATGTAFSVEVLGGEIHVVLYQGKIAVSGVRPPTDGTADRSKPSPASQALTDLAPGYQLVTPIEVAEARIELVDPVRSRAWEAGELVFVNEPLSNVVERMNRYSDQKLLIGDASAGAVLISGVFDGADTPAFVEGVTGVFPVRAHHTPSGVRLVSAR